MTGISDVTSGTFSPLLHTSSRYNPADQFAEAYQLTLTDKSATTAQVSGFAVVFYAQGRELDSDSQLLSEPAFITAAKSLTWTETPWLPPFSPGQPETGPYAISGTNGYDASSTCKLVQWH